MDKMDKVEQLEQNCWTILSPGEKEAVHKFSGGYIKFLNESKTEREAVDYIYGLALEAGFIPLEKCSQLNPGQRIVMQAKGKVCALIILGPDPLEEGVNIVASHIDSPRLDLKARPLYEEEGLAWLKTHYYGGIKKYQWLAIPLAMHGVVIKKNGEKVNIVIGENPQDPVLTIADLLPHLPRSRWRRKCLKLLAGRD